ncbi:hypothetical protein ACEYYB_01915 [Paracoccus sp. p4-l81]|uniref:hypothetical protein n=1 Tax=unclassified Paracoccus (in: a-proteobacteria) TaxID=2688777 RepID=UPI0035B9C354
MRNLSIAALIAAALPGLAVAGPAQILDCAFATECLDGDCAASGYALTLNVTDAPDAVTAELRDDAETAQLRGQRHGGALALDAGTTLPARLVSIGADGAARYTTHLTDPVMSITYVGHCKEAA